MTRNVLGRRALFGVAAATVCANAIPSSVQAAVATPRRALVLSGGGTHGAYEAGVIAGLVQTGGLDGYDVVCGTSIGSLNAALVATGQGAKVRDLWHTLAAKDVLRPKREFAAFDGHSNAVLRGVAALRLLYGTVKGRVTGFVDPAPLHALISSYMLLPGGAAKAFTRPFLWTATDLTTTCGVGFMREASDAPPGRSLPTLADVSQNGTASALVSLVGDADLVAALQASAAIPGVFDPVDLQGRMGSYVDGGVLDNAPLNLARYAGATQIDTVLLVRRVSGASTFRNAVAIVEEAYGIMRQRILDDAVLLALLQSDPEVRSAMRAALTRSPLRDGASPAFRTLLDETSASVTIRALVPSQPLAGSGFDARDQDLIDKNVALGYSDLVTTGFQPIAQTFDSCLAL